MKKNYWIFVVIFTVAFYLITGCMRPERTYEVIGLPNSEEIWNSLKIAIPLIIIGFLIAYTFVWRKKGTEDVGSTSTKLGCLGMIVMAVGAFFDTIPSSV